MTVEAPRPLRAILKLTYRCNSRCLFCRSSDLRGRVDDVPAGEACRRMARARELGVEMVLFSGGEPTLRDDLPALAAAATALGLRWGLITNGRRLAYPAYRDALLAAGLAYVHTSLHGSLAATHDDVTQCASFDQVLACLDGLAGTGVELHVNTVICRQNAGELAGISDLLAARAPLTHKLCLAEPKGLFLENADRVLLPPHAAAAAAVACLRRAATVHGQVGLSTVVEGFPLCQVADAADAVSGLRGHNIAFMAEVDEDDLHPTDDGEREFPPPCASCALRSRCPGVYAGYARRYGGEGLRPL